MYKYHTQVRGYNMQNSADAVRQWRKNTKQKMIDAMGGACQCCGYNTCTSALAFHHLDPLQKETGFGDTRSNPKNWSKIVNELKKCILVCHNCHSEIHHGMRHIPETFALFNETYAEWRVVEEYDNCPICKNNKPVKQKFCSHKCAQTNSRKVDWDKIDLLLLLKEYTISELETKLGVSNATIYKRRDKILGK
jgi:predicted nucleic acid-binding Zn ribbon protein